jgi:hypothetical protein
MAHGAPVVIAPRHRQNVRHPHNNLGIHTGGSMFPARSLHALLLLALAAPAFAAPEPAAPETTGAATPQAFRAALAAEFEHAPPELTRYEGLASYGETFSGSRRDAASLRALQALYADAVRLGLVQHADQAVITLCHELIVFGTPQGLECLRALARQKDTVVGDYLPVGILAAGEAGEQVAVERLRDPDPATREAWARLLAGIAIYASSVKPLTALLRQEREPAVRDGELRALAHIGDPAALPAVKPLLAAQDDATRAGALFAYTELRGRDGLPELRRIAAIGPESKRELADAIDYLQTQTSAQSPFGASIINDSDFWMRFADLKNPVVDWINAHPALERNLASDPPLDAADKRALFELLADSKGFGLEAVKGSLRASAARADLAPLLRIRQSVWISPNGQSEARMHSVEILIRTIRREVK